MNEDRNFGQSQSQSSDDTTPTHAMQTGVAPAGVSQTGHDTDGRSPEYRDGLTVQDESKPAGTTDWNDTATGIRPAGSGATGWADQPSHQRDAATRSDGGAARDWRDNTDGAGRDRTDAVTSDETGSLISADKVQGTAVYDGNGERLGTIDSLMLNKRAGKVAYAVMSFGGFLGIGERYHPLPWDSLTYDTDKGGYNVGHTVDTLRSGPSYSRDELDSFDGGKRASEVDDYYGRSALGGGITGAGGIPIV